MKQLLALALTVLITSNVFAQDLKGEWKGIALLSLPHGSYSTSQHVTIYFQPISDSGYKVYSYCRGKDHKNNDTVIVAKVAYSQPSVDSIFLQEVQVLKPDKVIDNCLLQMHLHISKVNNEPVLTGRVNSSQKGCDFTGTISFTRSNSEPKQQ